VGALRPKRRVDGSEALSLDVLGARLATRQSGVVSTAQLLALGLTRDAIKHRVRAGRLIRVHQGVYAVGHEALTDRSLMIAALLAAGPGAALSHRTAAHLYGLLPSMPQLVHLTLTDRAPRSRAGPTRSTQIDGYAVARFTWRQVMETTIKVVVGIGQLLARRGRLAA
jgi:predicted transcriptional regulator of viral defense system